jgi:hypothetical protein
VVLKSSLNSCDARKLLVNAWRRYGIDDFVAFADLTCLGETVFFLFWIQFSFFLSRVVV